MSPDPLAGDIQKPQSLNRYAYVLNNPESLVDPLGLCVVGTPPPDSGSYSVGANDRTTIHVTSYTVCSPDLARLEWNGSPFPGPPTPPPDSVLYSVRLPKNLPTMRARKPQRRGSKQSYQRCMSNWSNTAAGQAVSFFSLLNLPSHIWEWVTLTGGKAGAIHVLDKLEQSTAVTDYSITAGTSAQPAVLDGSAILGQAGFFGVGAVTAVDAAGRFGCYVQDPNVLSLGSPIMPVFP